MGSKNKNQRKGKSDEAKGSGGVAAADEGVQMIKDPRFSSAHTDPRFRRVPRRESKVTIDSRFQGVFTDKRFATASAPVDKRGKRRRGGSGKDSLREYYRIEKEENTKPKKEKKDCEEESGDESDSENEMMNLKSESKRRKSEKSSDSKSEEYETRSEKNFGSLDEESDEKSDSEEEEDDEELSEEEEEEVDTDDDDEAIYEDDGSEIPEENIPTIPEETHRLAIVNMDWRHVSAKDLYVVLNSFVPKDGRILSVAVYPTEFGLERMKEEEIHGPVIDGDKKNEDYDDEEEDDEEEEDEDVINQKLRAYETSRLKYYFAVAECDSSATADYLYKSCDGIEFERSSNKLDLRFIPDSMEFKHPPRDMATEAPAGYEGLDFQTRALQLSKVNLSWDEDEPHRIKTLNQKFKPEQLADLEMKEFLASDESESDDDDDNEGLHRSKEEKRKDKYRALIESEDVDSDKEAEEDNDQDMEVTFNTGLEDLSREILKKKDKKSESVWEAYLRQKREKKRARKSKQKDDDSSPDDDDDDDYNIDGKSVNDDGDDDFFMEEPAIKKKKEGKMKKKKKGLEEEVAAEERSRAELELLLADENGAANGLKGYNIKRKGKKGKTDIEEKIPAADLDDPRFAALLSSPSFALDPTDPQFKRSATYVRQLAAKQKEEPRSHEDVKEMTPREKLELNSGGNLESKKEKHALTSTVKSLKMKMLNKDSEKKKAGNALSSPTLAQRIKKKAKDLSNK